MINFEFRVPENGEIKTNYWSMDPVGNYIEWAYYPDGIEYELSHGTKLPEHTGLVTYDMRHISVYDSELLNKYWEDSVRSDIRVLTEEGSPPIACPAYWEFTL